MPTTPKETSNDRQSKTKRKVLAIVLPAVIGLLGAAFSVYAFEDYGWTLFLALPIIVSFLSTMIWSSGQKTSYWSNSGLACASILLLGLLLILFAIDGLVCLIMALSLAVILAQVGTLLGIFVSRNVNRKNGTSISLMVCLLFPCLVSFENATKPPPSIRKVTSSVLIDAPINEVWQTVIAFPDINTPAEGIFKMGIAYPIKAHIDGQGVGAIRYCCFSTGDFVEPITVWNEPHHLAFTVSENPAPMEELTIYGDFHAPHLHGHMVSKKGQFILKQQGDKVLLEGTTWYSHSISPEFYWGIISDEIIHKVHYRVLDHIKAHVEKN
ncbi:hypothetical protein [Persicirhabdus sediminis]|uniref:Polyketide cyclase / dehydrase and lipid transport n=1 Tax=Persicirhabdus sediminis TaxID=454144 RepID=A0A8J7MCF4_9BACT|nr:hypothetical protein [Persicirhabdus sediminis]MBK1790587.1 hypothetical protein [Persicirhabdus sediminis]